MYRLTASPVTVSNATYTSTPASWTVTVTASTAPSQVMVAYAIASGSLSVTVAGLPSGPASVIVTAPGGFYRLVTGTTTLANLTPGMYTLTAASVFVSNATYSPLPVSSTVAVSASATPTPATVTYGIASGSLLVTVTGLPSGPAAITVTGPGGFNQTLTATTTLSNLTPGSYTLTPSPVIVSNATYASTQASAAIVVAGSTTPTVVLVTYVLASGSLQVTVTGLPSGPAAIDVAGPGGFNQTMTATTTLTNLAPGAYTLTASPVVVSPLTYTSTPDSSIVTVNASLVPTSATFSYQPPS
jgi:hypothetical protein